jgi:hypothetical protein
MKRQTMTALNSRLRSGEIDYGGLPDVAMEVKQAIWGMTF